MGNFLVLVSFFMPRHSQKGYMYWFSMQRRSLDHSLSTMEVLDSLDAESQSLMVRMNGRCSTSTMRAPNYGECRVGRKTFLRFSVLFLFTGLVSWSRIDPWFVDNGPHTIQVISDRGYKYNVTAAAARQIQEFRSLRGLMVNVHVTHHGGKKRASPAILPWSRLLTCSIRHRKLLLQLHWHAFGRTERFLLDSAKRGNRRSRALQRLVNSMEKSVALGA